MTRWPRGPAPAPQQARYLPASGDADQIERTATQVRAGRVVHTRTHSLWTREHGHHYRTGCGLTVYGAALTTRDTTCVACEQSQARTDPAAEGASA